MQTLSRRKGSVSLPATHEQLRVMIVDELLNNCALYNLKMDRETKKHIQLMKSPG